MEASRHVFIAFSVSARPANILYAHGRRPIIVSPEITFAQKRTVVGDRACTTQLYGDGAGRQMLLFRYLLLISVVQEKYYCHC